MRCLLNATLIVVCVAVTVENDQHLDCLDPCERLGIGALDKSAGRKGSIATAVVVVSCEG